ncbi:MAG: hypothetical protein RLZZ531_636 [Bacteroidota bacterium]|jgi:hypothetical protein
MKILFTLILMICFSRPPKFEMITYSNENVHARSIQNFSKNELLIGTNVGKYVLISKNSTKPVSMYLPTTFHTIKEIRDADKNERYLFFMQSNDESHVLRQTWTGNEDSLLNFSHHGKPVFLDGITLQDSLGFLIGDPVDGDFALFRTKNFGESWEACPGKVFSQANEAAYAASGTTNHIIEGDFVFVSGGETSRFIWSSDLGESWLTEKIPFESCKTCGAYSLAYKNRKELVAVGGDYTRPNESRNTCFYSLDGGLNWSSSKNPPLGYRSCVIFANGMYFACGTNGIDYSSDHGANWKSLLKENALSMTTDKRCLYVSCMGGKIIKLKLPKK